MKHLFVSYEIAKTLKEKGFNEECIAYYLGSLEFRGTEHDLVLVENEINKLENNWKTTISAPLYQQVIGWFREKHGIYLGLYNLYGKNSSNSQALSNRPFSGWHIGGSEPMAKSERRIGVWQNKVHAKDITRRNKVGFVFCRGRKLGVDFCHTNRKCGL